ITPTRLPSRTPAASETPVEPLQEAQYLYDGDNNLVKSVVNGKTTYYPGRHYQQNDDTIHKCYTLGRQFVAVRTIQDETDTLHWVLDDHLGSTSVTASEDGAWNSEIKYTAYGEVRWKSGLTPTSYRYTAQLEQPEAGLYFYVARFYDPALRRFIQADTLVPEGQGVQAWDRYAFANNNPVKYTDTSGHCIFCLVAAIGGGVILGTAIYNNFIHTPSAPANGDASNLLGLLLLGYEHAGHANIVGEGLQSLQDDPSVQAAQGRIVDQIHDDQSYGHEAYSMPDISENFTANGPGRKWWLAALEGNQAFFMVHTGTLSATNTTVAADGTISTTWIISDNFDYLPDFKNHGFDEYNFFAVLIYPVYNVLLGAAEQYPTSASWQETIPPQTSNGETPFSHNSQRIRPER
ncbi:MAG: RHS repeat-associated core domain-containing protein, partial [Anaerolineae bacterium]|nr:RHS repeat-associated core domain-containing protein [Anaerolineae bacterium]